MNAIAMKVGGKKYQLTEAGAVLDESLAPSTDSWTSLASAEDEKNTLRYTLQGIPQRRIRVHYSFNSDNQLVVSAFKKENPELDEDSISVLAGGIDLDSNFNIVYSMIDSAGKVRNSMTVFGKISLQNPFVLKIALVGGGEARIVANAKKGMPLVWDKNRSHPEVDADDELAFKAVTRNNLKSIGGKGYQFVSSNLQFPGSWGMDKDGLAFEVEGGTGGTLRLTLEGKYKAISGGLIFEYKEGQASCGLAIEGRHKFDQGTATWHLQIGHSQQARQTYTSLKLDGELKHQIGADKTLTLKGSLKLEAGEATGPSVDLAINATYEFTGGVCLIKAFYDMHGQRQSYGLQISGDVTLKKGKMTFDFSYGSDKAISFEVTYDGTADEFFSYFHIKVKIDAQGHVTADISFRIEFRFENGVLMPAKVTKQAA